jgi:hypothetical protein
MVHIAFAGDSARRRASPVNDEQASASGTGSRGGMAKSRTSALRESTHPALDDTGQLLSSGSAQTCAPELGRLRAVTTLACLTPST